MKFLITLGFTLGLGVVLTAAWFVPVASHERIASRTGVANNGGRLETFVIRLPADRIVAAGSVAQNAISVDPVTQVDAPAELANSEFLVEQFKIRNIDGDVIGVAMRHWTRADASAASTWSVSIPSRGTLVWSAVGDAPAQLAAALTAAGIRAGSPWQGQIVVPIAGEENPGQIILGTEEFSGSTGVVEEVWDISGVGSLGELRGTISLNTRASQSS